MVRSIALAIGLLVAVSAAAEPDPWSAVRFLLGTWEGQASGQPGKGVSTREYRWDLNGKFIAVSNKSTYEPKAPGEKPEVHEDFGMFSYDRALKKVVLRQFHVEGFVNEYTLDSVSQDGGSLEFVSVRIENIQPGWRAREVYQRISPDEFVETFSLASPGKDFEVYSTTRLKRKR